jgi:hypothetical protein
VQAEEEAGFAAVDAIVALAILSLTLAFATAAATTAVKASRRAAETRRAEALLDHEIAIAEEGAHSGVMGGFAWSSMEDVLDNEAGKSAIRMCRVTASARSGSSGRLYSLVTYRACPVPPKVVGP